MRCLCIAPRAPTRVGGGPGAALALRAGIASRSDAAIALLARTSHMYANGSATTAQQESISHTSRRISATLVLQVQSLVRALQDALDAQLDTTHAPNIAVQSAPRENTRQTRETRLAPHVRTVSPLLEG